MLLPVFFFMGFISTANRKRPQDFNELEGQDFVVTTIRNAIENNRFAHAYLFAGPRGVGKTTSARLLAKSLNCKHGPSIHPCNKCESCVGITASSSIDCIEIDGASNTSVEDIRRIKSDIMYPPSSRFKIYIIDEVHMLSNSAFNALLKTIEEPPDYVIFIFATTEIQKVPQTIKSRCQFFRFKSIGQDLVKGRIRSLCDELGMSIDDQSLSYIARESEGSMRDAYTIFDQLSSFCGKSIVFGKIEKELLLTPYEKIADILSLAVKEDAKGILETFFDLQRNGVQNEQFVSDFAFFIRCLLLHKSGISDRDMTYFSPEVLSRPDFASLTPDNLNLILDDLLKLYRDMRYSINPGFDCELFLANLARIRMRLSNFEIAKRLAAYERSSSDGDSDSDSDEAAAAIAQPAQARPVGAVSPTRPESAAKRAASSSRAASRHQADAPSVKAPAPERADSGKAEGSATDSDMVGDVSNYDVAAEDAFFDVFKDDLIN